MKIASLLRLLIPVCSLGACNQIKKADPPGKQAVAPTHYDLYVYALQLTQTNQDSAFYYFNTIATSAKDSILIAGAYTYMGIIQNSAGDYFGSQESLLQSLKFLDEKNSSHGEYFASSYNELGKSCRNLKNYDDAFRYFDLAVKFSKDSTYRFMRLNNKAAALKDKRHYNDAINIYRGILDKTTAHPVEYARILSNLAHVKWLKDAAYPAGAELVHALKIRKEENDEWGLNASYAHLSDYYARFLPDSALLYAQNMYRVAARLNSPDDELEALEKLFVLAPSTSLKTYLARYQYLNDSLHTARNNAKNQFALIRYETEKHKSANLVLQKENAERKITLAYQQGIFAAGIFILLAVFWWYRKRKQQAMQKQQFRTSQKVHDIVANGLYNIMKKIEYGQELGKEHLLDDMEILYEQSRNISYDSPAILSRKDEEALPLLLTSFSTPQTSVSIVGYSLNLWNTLQPETKHEVRFSLENLMINMKKHSRARNVVIRFGQQDGKIRIHYTDDGIGLPANFRYGKGLSSTETRIAGIGGKLIFDTSVLQGVKIQIIIPIEQAQ